jgi:hypothetical protein
MSDSGSEGLGFESQRDHTGIGEANPAFEQKIKSFEEESSLSILRGF